MSDRLKKSIGRLFEKKLDSQQQGPVACRNEPKLLLERSAYTAAILESPTHAKSQNSIEITTSSNNPPQMNSPKARNSKVKPTTLEPEFPQQNSTMNRTTGSNSKTEKPKDPLKKLSALQKLHGLPTKLYSPASYLKRAVSPIQLATKEKPYPPNGSHKDDTPGIRLRLNTLSQSRLAQSTFQQPIKASNPKFASKPPIQLSASVYGMRNRLHLSPSSSVSQESLKGCRKLKGSEREIRLRLAEMNRKIGSKVEKRFERLERELRELKKEILRKITKSFEQCLESLKSGADLDFELEYKKLELPNDRSELLARLGPIFREEKLTIKIEPQTPVRLSFEEYAAENLTKAGPSIDFLAKTGTVEASFTKFFENNSKLDFIDYVDPETFFQPKKQASFLQEKNLNDVLSEAERDAITENNFFQTTFKN